MKAIDGELGADRVRVEEWVGQLISSQSYSWAIVQVISCGTSAADAESMLYAGVFTNPPGVLVEVDLLKESHLDAK